MYLADVDFLLKIWGPFVGYYGSLTLYALPWIWAVAQIAQLQGDIYLQTYTNSIVLLIVMMANWIFTGFVHIFYTDNMLAHLQARSTDWRGDPCTC